MYDHNSIPGFYLSDTEVQYLKDIDGGIRPPLSTAQARSLIQAYRRRMDELPLLLEPPSRSTIRTRYDQLNRGPRPRWSNRGPLGMSPGVWVTYTEVKLTAKHEVYDNIRIHEGGTEETILFQLKPGEKFAWWPYSLDMEVAIQLWSQRFETEGEEELAE